MLRRLTLLALAASLLAGTASAQTVVIVRHGERAGPGRDPELSPAGQARAEALARALAGARVVAVLATPLKRTQQTAQPTARSAGVAVGTVTLDGGEAAHVQEVAERARKAPADGAVLIVGHSNTVAEIARALGDPAPQPIADCDFDRMTVLQLGGPAPRVVHARYCEPSPSC
jgi:broad specificity phosphatase PhoE